MISQQQRRCYRSSSMIHFYVVGVAVLTAAATLRAVVVDAKDEQRGSIANLAMINDDPSSYNLRSKHSKHTKNRAMEMIQSTLVLNEMYDNSITSPAEEFDMLNVEAAAFRLITAQSSRIFQYNRTWCFAEPTFNLTDPRRPYKYWNFAVHAIALLNTIVNLQMLPSHCLVDNGRRYDKLRNLLIPGGDTSSITTEYVRSNDVIDTASEVPAGVQTLEWWEEKFLPTVAEAFSCGYSEKKDNEEVDLGTVSSDIRPAFPESLEIRQVWRLMKGFLRSPQKQRERNDRQQDFDVSLYVPFLPPKEVPMARIFLGVTPQPGNNKPSGRMRVGTPHYQGPATWFLWHTAAARYYELELESGTPSINILLNFRQLVEYFGMTHPCPYCRDHFLTRVSRNDNKWVTLNTGVFPNPVHGCPLDKTCNATTKEPLIQVSESNIYPLEYLFVGSTAENLGASTRDKFNSIKDGKSLMTFFWKIHNAVASSVTTSFTCKSQEFADLDASFSCYASLPDNTRGITDIEYIEFGQKKGESTTRGLGRAWPTASRFQFWLLPEGDKGTLEVFNQARENMGSAELILNNRDKFYGIRLRQDMWTLSTNSSSVDQSVIDQIRAASTELDKSVVELLYTQYKLSYRPSYEEWYDSVRNFVPLNVSSPLDDDGYFPFLPKSCFPEGGGRRVAAVYDSQCDV